VFFWLDFIFDKTIWRERKCVRRLRIIPSIYLPGEHYPGVTSLQDGGIYICESFNGFTYKIRGFDNVRIGYANCEILPDTLILNK
jgi:hypothetical protein